VTVFIADDHPVYRDGLAEAIKRRPDLELVGHAESGREALEKIRELQPAVAIVDAKMPELDGTDVTRAVVRDDLPTKIIFLSGYLDSRTIYAAMEAGARGFISKDSRPETICAAVLEVARGGTVLGSETHAALRDEIKTRSPSPTNPLTEREREILRLVADGHQVASIAERIYLSPATVKTHLQRTYQKLGVSDRAAAVAEAMRRGLLE
jgi:two-component system nitrate/nitrite response regulator NarL